MKIEVTKVLALEQTGGKHYQMYPIPLNIFKVTDNELDPRMDIDKFIKFWLLVKSRSQWRY